jgi:hypothetical protein
MSRDDRQSAAERREYFRIEDNLLVAVDRVPAAELEARLRELELGSDSDFTVMSSLAGVTAQMAVYLRRIENDLPDVAAYLKAIDRKLEILGRAFLTNDKMLSSDHAQHVNLSAGGACLHVAECYAPGTVVEVRMLLFPSFTGLLTYADVVGCEPDQGEDGTAGEGFRLRVEFTHMREQDRDILIRHILRRQGEELRARRGEM